MFVKINPAIRSLTQPELEAAYKVIADVLYKYTFTHPVSGADCDHVRADILQALPGFTSEVCHRFTQVSVEIWAPNGTRIYARNLSVKT